VSISNHSRQTGGQCGELELFVARSGLLSARINRNGRLVHLHSAVKPESEADHFSGMEFWGDLIVFLGAGLGYHIAPYLNSIPAGAKILLIDYYPRCIEHCREKCFAGLTHDITALSGETASPDRIARECSAGARYIQVIKHPASYHANRDFYESIMAALRFKRIRASEAATALLFSGSFFVEQELSNALSAAGRGPALFRYNDMDHVLQYESQLSKAIQEHRPRYILSVNMKGFDGSGIVCDVSRRMGVPVIIWFVDDPHPIMLSQQAFTRDHMRAFSWERSYLPWLSRLGFGGAHYLPLAGDPALPAQGKATKTIAELGFVGSSMGRAYLDDLASRFLWTPALEPLVQEAAERLLKDRIKTLPELISETCASLGCGAPFSDARNRTWLSSYIIHTASMLQRKRIVGACIPHGIETFGDPKGWKDLLGDHVPTHPDIDYHTGLSAVYSSIAITINITSCQMQSAVNQRVFDIPLCNGFVLNDQQDDLFELFAPDEIAVYSSPEDLAEKIAFFRAHPEERSRITAKAAAAVLANHTYSHRLAALEKVL
jgi:spore maturation protein CgeB